jgi:3-oxoacyl-[acyl-carrier protein] reductase
MDLSGKRALVTGASRGIGRATAIALAREGADVMVNYFRSRAAAMEVKEAIEGYGRRAVVVQADVSVPSEVERLFREIDTHFGGLDILINNAAISHIATLEQSTEESWNAVLQGDLTSMFLCTQAAAVRMIPKRYGRIVNISSIGGVLGIEIDPAYGAAKAGVLGFTKSIARALGRHDITVNAVCPGYIETDMSAALPDQARAWSIQESALHRLGVPEDVADAIVFFASDYSRHITGQTILVDGGVAMI